jgi:hypothetical protein
MKASRNADSDGIPPMKASSNADSYGIPAMKASSNADLDGIPPLKASYIADSHGIPPMAFLHKILNFDVPRIHRVPKNLLLLGCGKNTIST